MATITQSGSQLQPDALAWLPFAARGFGSVSPRGKSRSRPGSGRCFVTTHSGAYPQTLRRMSTNTPGAGPRALSARFFRTAFEPASRATRKTEVASSAVQLSTNENVKRDAPSKDGDGSERGRRREQTRTATEANAEHDQIPKFECSASWPDGRRLNLGALPFGRTGGGNLGALRFGRTSGGKIREPNFWNSAVQPSVARQPALLVDAVVACSPASSESMRERRDRGGFAVSR